MQSRLLPRLIGPHPAPQRLRRFGAPPRTRHGIRFTMPEVFARRVMCALVGLHGAACVLHPCGGRAFVRVCTQQRMAGLVRIVALGLGACLERARWRATVWVRVVRYRMLVGCEKSLHVRDGSLDTLTVSYHFRYTSREGRCRILQDCLPMFV